MDEEVVAPVLLVADQSWIELRFKRALLYLVVVGGHRHLFDYSNSIPTRVLLSPVHIRRPLITVVSDLDIFFVEALLQVILKHSRVAREIGYVAVTDQFSHLRPVEGGNSLIHDEHRVLVFEEGWLATESEHKVEVFAPVLSQSGRHDEFHVFPVAVGSQK